MNMWRMSIWFCLVLVIGCTSLGQVQRPAAETTPAAVNAVRDDCADIKARLCRDFGDKVPRQWGEAVDGVLTRLSTDQNVIALTLDACGSPRGSGYDAELINFLEQEQVSATLFINSRWILANPDAFRALARTPLFEIANHGLLHKPCSVTGRSAYGIQGTATVADLVDEIEINGRMINDLTGHRPAFYRPGTAYSDEIGVKIAMALGYTVAGFSVLGDAGATYTREQVRDALLAAPPGAIVILHMNHPEGQTCRGVMDAIPELKKRGVRFVTLSEGVLLERVHP
ncbi:MAG TPA: polysaccharide deacetylase family protein [Syntrophales bacterium]|nr:polysaccharide deacetylase family protein [Syntrophales bacterium]